MDDFEKSLRKNAKSRIDKIGKASRKLGAKFVDSDNAKYRLPDGRKDTHSITWDGYALGMCEAITQIEIERDAVAEWLEAAYAARAAFPEQRAKSDAELAEDEAEREGRK